MFKSYLIEPDPAPKPEAVRRVIIELPESRALALSRVINEHIPPHWSDTEAVLELGELHEALGEDWRKSYEI